MNFTIGQGRYRVELQISRVWIWYRLPFIGQGHWTKGNYWAVDNWATIKDDGTTGW